MAQTAVKYESGFNVVECCVCAVPFGITEWFEKMRRKDHAWFYCPAGHYQHYPAETQEEKLTRKADMLADQVRMEREQREKLERKLKRVEKGTCPQCNRHFVNVERHMFNKHKHK